MAYWLARRYGRPLGDNYDQGWIDMHLTNYIHPHASPPHSNDGVGIDT
jgi:hypothetical protein